MLEILSKIVDKLSAYQLFNYFFPGIIFNFCLEQIVSYRIAPNDILYRVFVYYLTGMIMSRLGSTIIEPLYKKIGIVIYAEYKKYLDASVNDSKLDILVLENNTYRTLIATFVSLFILFLIDQIEWFHGKYQHPIAILIYLLMLIFLFSSSFKKQTSFIRKKVHRNLNLKDEEESIKLKDKQKHIKIWSQIF